MDGVETSCSSVEDGVGFLSLEINEILIPAHLAMLDEKECNILFHLTCSNGLELTKSGWHGFSFGYALGIFFVKNIIT
jgi:hypothetical protein